MKKVEDSKMTNKRNPGNQGNLSDPCIYTDVTQRTEIHGSKNIIYLKAKKIKK